MPFRFQIINFIVMNYKPIPIIAILFFAACNDTETSLSYSNTIVPVALNYIVTNVYPHDSTSFTEGLEWHDNTLYESSGEYGTSSLTKINLDNGKALQKLTLENKYFGEGITILNGKIYQLTYKEGKCFVYDLKTFKKLKEFNYEGQGWGMTNDGKNLIMDDSTETLTYRNPNTFEIIKKIKVRDNNGPLPEINELEYADNFIYANVWKRDIIVKINPSTGSVIAIADISEIWKTIGQQKNDKAEVLNGIAYDSLKKRFFITGKYWNKLFGIKFN